MKDEEAAPAGGEAPPVVSLSSSPLVATRGCLPCRLGDSALRAGMRGGGGVVGGARALRWQRGSSSSGGQQPVASPAALGSRPHLATRFMAAGCCRVCWLVAPQRPLAAAGGGGWVAADCRGWPGTRAPLRPRLVARWSLPRAGECLGGAVRGGSPLAVWANVTACPRDVPMPAMGAQSPKTGEQGARAGRGTRRTQVRAGERLAGAGAAAQSAMRQVELRCRLGGGNAALPVDDTWPAKQRRPALVYAPPLPSDHFRHCADERTAPATTPADSVAIQRPQQAAQASGAPCGSVDGCRAAGRGSAGPRGPAAAAARRRRRR